jgi:transcriptional regulator with XRE-family HTH domain
MEARRLAGLTQHAIAARVGTSQPSIARVERGTANPTVDTLVRWLAAAGFEARVELVPITPPDAVVARYMEDVDRTLLRANLATTIDHRLRTLDEWQRAGAALEHATRRARRQR